MKYTYDIKADSVIHAVYQLKYANEILGRKPRFIVLARDSYAQLFAEAKSKTLDYEKSMGELQEVLGLQVVRTGEPGMSIHIGE